MWCGVKTGTSLQSSATTNKWIDGFFVCLSIILDGVTPLECWKIVFYFRGSFFLFLRSYNNHYWFLNDIRLDNHHLNQFYCEIKRTCSSCVTLYFNSTFRWFDIFVFSLFLINHGITFLALPTSMKASTVLSMSSVVWAAEICTRIRAFPLGTTG